MRKQTFWLQAKCLISAYHQLVLFELFGALLYDSVWISISDLYRSILTLDGSKGRRVYDVARER